MAKKEEVSSEVANYENLENNVAKNIHEPEYVNSLGAHNKKMTGKEAGVKMKKVTAKMLEENPELEAKGVKVGDKIEVASEEDTEQE